jgi:hypothetical protein
MRTMALLGKLKRTAPAGIADRGRVTAELERSYMLEGTFPSTPFT